MKAALPAPAPAATALKSDKRTIQGGASAPLPRVAPAASGAAFANALADFGDEDESTRIADASALAGTFSLAVGGASEAPPADALSMPADEWFVGINGVPVGPIRLSELRSKAASGSVTRESLVWRDGFEDWRPLKTFPELVAIVDESVSSARASLTPFTPSVAIAGPAIAAAVSDPFAMGATAGSKTPDPFAMGATAGVTGTAVVTDDLEAAGIRKRGGSSPAAWIAVAIALLFGLTIGFVLFNKQQKPTEVLKYVDRVVPGAASVAAGSDKVTPLDEATVGADNKNGSKHVGGTAKPGASADADKGICGAQGLERPRRSRAEPRSRHGRSVRRVRRHRAARQRSDPEHRRALHRQREARLLAASARHARQRRSDDRARERCDHRASER